MAVGGGAERRGSLYVEGQRHRAVPGIEPMPLQSYCINWAIAAAIFSGMIVVLLQFCGLLESWKTKTHFFKLFFIALHGENDIWV
jgi:hypothetical protein